MFSAGLGVWCHLVPCCLHTHRLDPWHDPGRHAPPWPLVPRLGGSHLLPEPVPEWREQLGGTGCSWQQRQERRGPCCLAAPAPTGICVQGHVPPRTGLPQLSLLPPHVQRHGELPTSTLRAAPHQGCPTFQTEAGGQGRRWDFSSGRTGLGRGCFLPLARQQHRCLMDGLPDGF